MIYLISYCKYAWRWMLIMFTSSMIMNMLGVNANNPIAVMFYVLCTSFAAWVWYCKQVIEVVDVDE